MSISSKLNTFHILIILLTLAAAVINFRCAEANPEISKLFILDGLDYILLEKL